MNLCFIIGEIVSDIQFDFFYNSKIHQSVVTFEIRTQYKGMPILAKAYDENADLIYETLDKGNIIKCLGKARESYIEITMVELSQFDKGGTYGKDNKCICM